MKTDRMTLLVTPKEKRAIAARARRAGVSASEYVRRAVSAYETPASGADLDARIPDELNTLVRELGRAADRMNKTLDAALKRSEEFEAFMAREDERRKEIRRELIASGAHWRWPVSADAEVGAKG